MLRERLIHDGIELSVAYGIPTTLEEMRQDGDTLSWGTKLTSRYFTVGNISLLWQSIPRALIADQDLVVLSHENGLLANYWLLCYRRLGGPRLAFWGHGKNFHQRNTNWFKDAWKRMFLCMPDWWFGYTDLTRNILLHAGYSDSKITILQNAIDTKELLSYSEQISLKERQSLLFDLKLEGRHVAVFCGSLYQGKRLDLLLSAAEQIKKRVNDFELIVIGSGPEEPLILNAAMKYSWLHYVGKRTGYEKALYMSLGHVFLLPHIVGLAILDSFALGLPLITMDNGSHSPEIAYLRHSANGLMCKNNLNSFVEETAALLHNPDRLQAMATECKSDARRYTVENMATRFAEGIIACLNADDE
jgi:glycosyltransferase involved in cell wall biosynthesis